MGLFSQCDIRTEGTANQKNWRKMMANIKKKGVDCGASFSDITHIHLAFLKELNKIGIKKLTTCWRLIDQFGSAFQSGF